jgi:hypothetical protein
MEEQLSQLQNPVDRLWWLAQMERGVEKADLDREPRIGSERVLERLLNIYERDPSRELEDVVIGWHEVKFSVPN